MLIGFLAEACPEFWCFYREVLRGWWSVVAVVMAIVIVVVRVAAKPFWIDFARCDGY